MQTAIADRGNGPEIVLVGSEQDYLDFLDDVECTGRSCRFLMAFDDRSEHFVVAGFRTTNRLESALDRVKCRGPRSGYGVFGKWARNLNRCFPFRRISSRRAERG